MGGHGEEIDGGDSFPAIVQEREPLTAGMVWARRTPGEITGHGALGNRITQF